MVKFTWYAYIRIQWVNISKNWHFVFEFTSLLILTVFSTVISTRRSWRRLMKCNPKPSKLLKMSYTKFQENRMETTAVTVLLFFRSEWRPWRHRLCKWVKTITRKSDQYMVAINATPDSNFAKIYLSFETNNLISLFLAAILNW